MSLNQIIDNPASELVVDTTLNLKANSIRVQEKMEIPLLIADELEFNTSNQTPMNYFQEYSVTLPVVYEDASSGSVAVKFQRLNDIVTMKIAGMNKTVTLPSVNLFRTIESIPAAFLPNYGNQSTTYTDCASFVLMSKVDSAFVASAAHLVEDLAEMRIYVNYDHSLAGSGSHDLDTLPYTFVWSRI